MLRGTVHVGFWLTLNFHINVQSTAEQDLEKIAEGCECFLDKFEQNPDEDVLYDKNPIDKLALNLYRIQYLSILSIHNTKTLFYPYMHGRILVWCQLHQALAGILNIF